MILGAEGDGRRKRTEANCTEKMGVHAHGDLWTRGTGLGVCAKSIPGPIANTKLKGEQRIKRKKRILNRKGMRK